MFLLLTFLYCIESLTIQELQTRFNASLTLLNVQESWSVSASFSQDDGRSFASLIDFDARQRRQPASNEKLLTTTTALHRLGADSSFVTRAFQNEAQTLCVRAAGDPNITTSDITAFANAMRDRFSFTAVALDSGAFANLPIYPSSWEIGDLPFDYGAPTSSLMLNENRVSFVLVAGAQDGATPTIDFADPNDQHAVQIGVDVETSSAVSRVAVSVTFAAGRGVVLVGRMPPGSRQAFTTSVGPQPMQRFGRNLAAAMGAKYVGEATCQGDSIGVLKQSRLYELLVHCLQVSDNLYAESILRALGVATSSSSSTISLDDVIARMRSLLPAAVANDVGTVADGSGLSRHNSVAPRAFDQLMQWVSSWTPTLRQQYVAALPLAGRSGTLKHRFVNTPADGRLSAKTGTESGISTLSGVAYGDNAPLVSFSIMVNGGNRSATEIRKDIDALAVMFAELGA